MPRNSSGIYTLPGGNPVTPGDVIEAAWANTTMEDVADALTNSLSRTGAGGMLAPFRIADGTITAPGLSFLNETNSGLYRQSAGQIWMSVNGTNVLQYTSNGVLVPVGKTLTAIGNIAATTLDVSTSATIELATLTGNTKLGKGTGTESLRVVPAALAVNWLRIYGAATGAGPTIDAQGSDTNINLNLAAKGTGSIVAASPVTLSSTLSVTGAITVTGGVTGPVTSSNAVLTGGTINNVVIGGSTPQTITGTTITSTVGFVGNLTGNVTGNTTGTHTGAVVGNVTGNVTGSLTGNVTAASGTSTFENVTINGSLDMNSATGSTITGLSTPTADSDAANKAYVDSVAQGIDAKASCLVATTGNITLSGTQTIDGVAVTAGQRVLVWQQSTSSQNGIYVSAAGAWARSTDCDTWAELVSAYTFIEQGTNNGNNGYICTVQAGGTLGTTSVTWVQFSGAGQINAGAGLSKTGNTLNVGTASSSRIVVNTDDIDLASTGITPGTYKSVTIDAYGRATGGTNPTTLSGYGITDAYTIAQVDALFGSTTSAAASAAAAATSASNAATSATNAANSATASAGSATSAAATYTNFNNQYLGSKSSNPTVNNTGGALVAGNLYWNSTASEMRVYSGSAWTAAYLPATGYLALTGGTLTGSLNFSGTALRITGDFSNATMLSRTLFQSNTTNGNTQVGAIPNGTSVNSAFFTYNNSDPTNASTGILRTNGSEVAVLSGITGTGTYLPLTFWTSNSERGRVTTTGNWLIGTTTDDTTSKLQVAGSAVISDNSANTALRITQTGAGNALLVEDSANPDSTPFVVDTNGQVIQGYTSAISSGVIATNPYLQMHGVLNGTTAIGLTNWSSSGGRTPSLNFNRSAGNAVNTRGALTASGTTVGMVSFTGDDGSSWLETARIEGAIDATPGTNDMPGRLVFSTTADGAASPTERLRISNTGAFGLSGANYGTAGQALISQGSGAAPVWGSAGISTGKAIAMAIVFGG